MAPADDLKAYAVSTHDFYELLSLPLTFQPSELDRARRKTALKYHPDKVGPDPVAQEKFHLAEAGYAILKDKELRALYDSTRSAREQKRRQDEALDGERRRMKEKLDKAERRGAKRSSAERDEGDDEETRLRQKLRRLKEDAERRKLELEEELRRERQQRRDAASAPAATSGRAIPAKGDRAPTSVREARAPSQTEGSPFVGKNGGLSLAEQVINRLRQQAA